MSSERVAVHIRAEDCGAGREERPGPVIAWQDYAPGWALLGFMAYVFVVRLFDTDRMLAWRVSREALGEGHLATLQMHMFAHASALHLAITAFAFVPLAALAVHRLGGGLCAWLRLGLLFEALGPPVPEIGVVVGGVDDGGRVAQPDAPADADGVLATVAESALGHVA